MGGMFDKPQYLTGKDGAGFVEVGNVFWLHNARIEGTTRFNDVERVNIKLKVSHERDGATEIVFTSGVGIANQVKRMTAEDRNAFPVEVRLDAIPATRAGFNPTFVLTPADQPVATGAGATDNGDF